MKIKNKSWSPLIISLPGGRALTLPARGIEEVSSQDFESPDFERLCQSRTVIVLPEESKRPSVAESEPDKPQVSPSEEESEPEEEPRSEEEPRFEEEPRLEEEPSSEEEPRFDGQ